MKQTRAHRHLNRAHEITSADVSIPSINKALLHLDNAEKEAIAHNSFGLILKIHLQRRELEKIRKLVRNNPDHFKKMIPEASMDLLSEIMPNMYPIKPPPHWKANDMYRNMDETASIDLKDSSVTDADFTETSLPEEETKQPPMHKCDAYTKQECRSDPECQWVKTYCSEKLHVDL